MTSPETARCAQASLASLGERSPATRGEPGLVAARLRRIERAPSDLFVTCPPQVLEFFHSARTTDRHALHRDRISLGFPLEHAPDESLVLDIQGALWGAGLVRSAGTSDILIAAHAIVNDTTVLTADHEFDHIASVSTLQHEYVAPSG